MSNKIIFGTDGWRGITGSQVNEHTVSQAAQAFALYLQKKNKSEIKTAVGFDGRKYSREFARIFAEVLSGNGISVFLSDRIIPTPVLSYYTKVNGLHSGIMITASHNPAKYNGIKFKASYGGPYLTEETIEVEKLLYTSAVKMSRINIDEINLFLPYFEQVNRLIDFDTIKKSGIDILIDSMAGAGEKVIQNILSGHGIESATIYGIAEDDFSGRQAEPIEKNLAPLSRKLSEGNFSLGIATDGDADRLGVLLDNGYWLSAQETILLISDYLCNKKSFSGNIVKTSSVTDKLRSLETDSRKIIDVQVGFKYICEEMIQGNVLFGCEESGGFGYGFHMPERDGIFSGLLISEILANSGFNKLSKQVEILKKKFGEIYYDRVDLDYEKHDRIELLPELFSSLPGSVAGFRIKNAKEFFSSRGIINGIKFMLEGSSRWLLLRSSETEPLVRIYSEGENPAEVKSILDAGIKLILNNK